MHHTDGGSPSTISGLPLRSASRPTIPFEVPTQSFISPPPLTNRKFNPTERSPQNHQSSNQSLLYPLRIFAFFIRLLLKLREKYRSVQPAAGREFLRRDFLRIRIEA